MEYMLLPRDMFHHLQENLNNMMINADSCLIQEGLDEGYTQIDDVEAAFCEVATVLAANGVDLRALLTSAGL